MKTMHILTALALTAAFISGGSCAVTPSVTSAVPLAEPTPAFAPVSAPPVTGYDALVIALPTFDLERLYEAPSTYGEVSVVRDVSFEKDSSILAWSQIERLEALRTYLVANAATAVRIVGHGDGAALPEREANLAQARAQAVARALTFNLSVNNKMVFDAASASGQSVRNGTAEIIVVTPSGR